MKTCLDCIPCFFKQALEAARLSGAGPSVQKKVLVALAQKLPELPLEASPPELARHIYGIAGKFTGKKDPYLRIKEKSNRLALKVYPRLKNKIAASRDELLTAVELAIAGNIIDYGVKNSLNVKGEIDKILKENRVISRGKKRLFNYPAFKSALKKAETVLYLADNAGEIVFDRLLIETIMKKYPAKKIIVAVKEKPVINDALITDARTAGMEKYARIVSSGLDTPGTVLKRCSKEFLSLFKKAGMVISKGQGNFEALCGVKKSIFYLFMAKCPVVAKEVKCEAGDIILMNNKAKQEGDGLWK